MPQVVLVMIAGAGLYAGYRWVSKVVSQVQETAQRMQAEADAQRAEAAMPKDLGTLEYDREANVYRPRRG